MEKSLPTFDLTKKQASKQAITDDNVTSLMEVTGWND